MPCLSAWSVRFTVCGPRLKLNIELSRDRMDMFKQRHTLVESFTSITSLITFMADS